MNEHSAKTELEKVWKKMEKICADLWSDSSPRAVAAQALMEEYKGEMARYDAQVVHAAVNQAQTAREHEASLTNLRAHYDAEMAGLKKRIELLDRLVKDKDAENASLLTSIADHEKKNADFHAQVLKMAAASDVAAASQMEELYRGLKQKEESLAGVWSKREAVLIEDDRVLRGILAARQAELEAWEKRRIIEEDSLKRNATDLEIKSTQLQQEYRLKQQELETLKASLQRNVTELVRQYQARLKGEPLTPLGS